jgi:hypothetical protein
MSARLMLDCACALRKVRPSVKTSGIVKSDRDSARRHFARRVLLMVDTRAAPRIRVNKQAMVYYGGDRYPCRLRDISTTGAALEFSEVINLVRKAKEFTLVLPEDGLTLPCRVVWQRDYRMGVAFDWSSNAN